jgi:voltage-gated potassium channel
MGNFKSDFQNIMEDFFGDRLNKKSLKFDLFIIFLILISSAIYVLETSVTSEFYLKLFRIVDMIIIFLFSIELILRYIVAPSKKKFFTSFYTWIDILTVVPFWFSISSQFVRMFRLFRIFRFLRFLKFSKRYFNSETFTDFSLEKLFIFRMLLTVFMFIFVASALIFQIENQTNPMINTFFDAFYFVLISVTTVGYGDIVVYSVISKLVIMTTVLAGIVVVPVHITTMIKYLAEEKDVLKHPCKRCGLGIHEVDARHCRHCGAKL